MAEKPHTDLTARKADARILLAKLEGKTGLSTFEMAAKLVADFILSLEE